MTFEQCINQVVDAIKTLWEKIKVLFKEFMDRLGPLVYEIEEHENKKIKQKKFWPPIKTKILKSQVIYNKPKVANIRNNC